MSKGLSKKLSKLKGRSFDEIRVRGSQAFASFAERRGWTGTSRLPSDKAFASLFDERKIEKNKISPDGLPEHFRNRTKPFFFAGLNEKDATVETLRAKFGGEIERVLINKANRICDGYFDLLGFRNLHFGEPVDWHLEPVSNKCSPLVHWSLINEIDPTETGDKKIVWELNRHQHFITLGRAYWRTNDERYAETFITHLCSWMDRNPPKLGVNWLSSLEVSFRAISWLWAFYLFKDSPQLTPEIFWRALKFLYLHASHLEKFLSFYSSPNTHITGEALGLFYLGLLLPEFKKASRWRDLGREILFREIDKQILSDGVYFERASYYQRYTVDFYLQLLILLERNGEPVPVKVKEKLQAALDHLMLITRPDGTTPLYGDDDGGRFLPFDERPSNDFRATLAIGATVFNRADYKFVASEAPEELVWLLGVEEGFEKFQNSRFQIPDSKSVAFTEGGYYVMRDGWSRETNFMLIDCGPHGFLNCGHAHADALSFDMVVRGKTLLVDSGTFVYTADKSSRDWFRSTRAHNTLTIDNESSSVPAGPFSWRHIAECNTEAWINNERFDFFSGSHNGYMRFAHPATHRRSVLFLKKDYWVIRDMVETEGEHSYELNFHFAPDVKPVPKPLQNELVAFGGGTGDEAGFVICCDGFDCGEVESGWISARYSSKEKADVIVCKKDLSGEAEFVSFIIPYAKHETVTRRIETNIGKGFRVELGGFEDTLLLKSNGGMIKTERFDSDFNWTWVRFDLEQKTIEELILIKGSRLSFDGQTIISFDVPVAFARAKRYGNKLHVETDTESFKISVPLITASVSR